MENGMTFGCLFIASMASIRLEDNAQEYFVRLVRRGVRLTVYFVALLLLTNRSEFLPIALGVLLLSEIGLARWPKAPPTSGWSNAPLMTSSAAGEDKDEAKKDEEGRRNDDKGK